MISRCDCDVGLLGRARGRARELSVGNAVARWRGLAFSTLFQGFLRLFRVFFVFSGFSSSFFEGFSSDLAIDYPPEASALSSFLASRRSNVSNPSLKLP